MGQGFTGGSALDGAARVELSQLRGTQSHEGGLKGQSQGPSRAPCWLFVLGLCPLQGQEEQAGLQCGTGDVPTPPVMSTEVTISGRCSPSFAPRAGVDDAQGWLMLFQIF